ncbi:carbamoyltransferase family protein [Pandoraea sp. PE-S2T-3]|uniref:carbamoyltransferase family protein n=1 Tax=Pandoraea sp. PE-S2T-3 TaxID=1986993 RepID=UPI000B40585E|nr:carbamoyltransferase C-terminal domain-containing protein [Pandoraea sp. PE-S2T-3]
MRDPVVVGINRTQDGSIAIMHGSSMKCCVQKERLTKRRHDWGKLGDVPLYRSHLPDLRQPVDLIVESYSSDKEYSNLDKYHDELREHLTFQGAPRIIQISHHLSHALSAFPTSPFEDAATMVIDSVGSPLSLCDDPDFVVPQGAAKHYEVASFYIGRASNLSCIHKQLWDGNRRNPVGLGQFYHLLTQRLFPGEGHEGTVMGLAPLGAAHTTGLPRLRVEGGDVFIPPEWIAVLTSEACDEAAVSFQHRANLAAAGQRVFEQALLAVTNWLQRETGAKNLCYAGGCALNCVANGVLLRDSQFDQIYIPPAPHDGGTAVGCAIFGLTQERKQLSRWRWTSDNLGPHQDTSQVSEVAAQHGDLHVSRPTDLVEIVASIVSDGNIVAVFQGGSEFGPRALGNRSILADPRYSVMTSWINQSIKGREWFRPVAPMVLESDATTIFDLTKPSPFMQFAASVRSPFRRQIPGGTHFDNSARLQTVSEDDNPFIHDLLKSFKSKTGVGVLLNTSFNAQGETIVETIEDAVRCFKDTTIHTLVVPPYLIQKSTPPISPIHLKSIHTPDTQISSPANSPNVVTLGQKHGE